MALSRHMTIRNAVQALLAAADPALADGGVIKGKRGRPVAEQFERQVHVYLDVSTPERAEFSGQPDDWMTRVRIECAARPTDDLTADENADTLATAVYALVAANAGLSGLTIDMVPVGMAWDTEEANTQLALVQLVFDAKHRTPATSIAA